MYKIAILECENSHANSFIDYILNSGKIDDVEIAGVYSDEEEACKKLNEQFGVYVAKNYDEFVGKIDGLIVTARHGNNHYKYAKPYIESGIPMFIDKPITICEKEAVEFMKELKANNVPVTGGSCCVYDSYVQHVKAVANGGRYGNVLGGYVRAPLNANSNYGGFYFYAQHLVQVMCEVFGNYPDSVQMFDKGVVKTLVVRYKDYDITGEFVADGKHLPPELIKLILKVKGTDKVALITDSLALAGTDVNHGFMHATEFIIEDGVQAYGQECFCRQHSYC